MCMNSICWYVYGYSNLVNPLYLRITRPRVTQSHTYMKGRRKRKKHLKYKTLPQSLVACGSINQVPSPRWWLQWTSKTLYLQSVPVVHSDRTLFIHRLVLSFHMYHCPQVACIPSISISNMIFILMWPKYLPYLFFFVITSFNSQPFNYTCIWLFSFLWNTTHSSVYQHLQSRNSIL